MPEFQKNSHLKCHQRILYQIHHLKYQWKCLSQFHYMYQPLLPVYFTQVFHQTSHFINQQKNITQVLKKPHHMICHQKSLPQFNILDQEHLPVDTPQYFHVHDLRKLIQKNLPYHIIFQQNNIPNLYITPLLLLPLTPHPRLSRLVI